MADFFDEERLLQRQLSSRAPNPCHWQFWTDGHRRAPLIEWEQNPTVTNVLQMDYNEAAKYLFESLDHTKAVSEKLQGQFDRIVFEFKEKSFWNQDGTTTKEWHLGELEQAHKKRTGMDVKLHCEPGMEDKENGDGAGPDLTHTACEIEVVLRASSIDKPVVFKDGFYRVASRVLYIKPCAFVHCEARNEERLSWLGCAKMWPPNPKGMKIMLKANGDGERCDHLVVTIMGIVGLWLDQGKDDYKVVKELKVLGCSSGEQLLAGCTAAHRSDDFLVHNDGRLHVAQWARHAFRQLCRVNQLEVRRLVPHKVVAADEIGYKEFWQMNGHALAEELGRAHTREQDGVGNHAHEVDIDDVKTFPPGAGW